MDPTQLTRWCRVLFVVGDTGRGFVSHSAYRTVRRSSRRRGALAAESKAAEGRGVQHATVPAAVRRGDSRLRRNLRNHLQLACRRSEH